MKHIVKLLLKRGYGTTNNENLLEKVEEVLNENKHYETQLKVIKEISREKGTLNALKLSVFRAFDNYDKRKELAEMILNVEGMEEVIVDELEERGFTIQEGI